MPWHPDLERAFNPSVVAIIGASRSNTSFIRNFQRLGFSGRIYPVNFKLKEILGLKVYPNLASIPEPIDLVIVATPALEVPAMLEDCITAGARNVHVYTAGFSESEGEEGKKLEQTIKEIAIRGGLNLIGPNCMGINVPRARMLTFQGIPIEAGTVAFLSQSGGHAMNFARYAMGFGIGFSKVISYGNGCVMDSTDFLPYLANDPETKIITLYIEGVKDGKELLKQVSQINRYKPIIVWKGGVSDSGARAVTSHTGALAGSAVVWEAFFKQTGAVKVSSLEELTDVTMTFLYLTPPRGRRVALFLGGGGHSVVTTDLCSREGLKVPTLTEETRRVLRSFIPIPGTSVRNPLDVELMQRDLSMFKRALEVVATDPLIDLLIVDRHLDMIKEAGHNAIREMGEFMCQFAQRSPKPVVAILDTWGGDPVVSSERSRLQKEFLKAGMGAYRTLPRACRALAKFIRYHEFQKGTDFI